MIPDPTELNLSLEVETGNGMWRDEDATTSWYVRGPAGAEIEIEPNASADRVRVTTGVPGIYQVRAQSINHARGEDCVVQDYRGIVGRAAGVQIELTWDTPGDPDQNDAGTAGNWIVGADLDLHLLHERSNGAFGHSEFDCNPGLPRAEWGAEGLAHDPELAFDDYDGAGPEVIVLASPESCVSYTIGVHYVPPLPVTLAPHFGPSFATVRVFFDGELREEWGGIKLDEGELWESLTIRPGGEVERISPQAPVIRRYSPTP